MISYASSAITLTVTLTVSWSRDNSGERSYLIKSPDNVRRYVDDDDAISNRFICANDEYMNYSIEVKTRSTKENINNQQMAHFNLIEPIPEDVEVNNVKSSCCSFSKEGFKKTKIYKLLR